MTRLRTRVGIALLASASLGGSALGAQAAAQPASRPPRRERVVVIDSVTVVDVAAGRLVPGQRIVMRGDSIIAVQSVATSAPDSVAERIDGRGAFAIPGLVDHHVHLNAGMDRVLAQVARGGVTMVQSMAGDNRVVGEYARRVLAKELAGPEIAYVSVMAGPDFFVDARFRAAGIGFAPGTAPWMQAVTAQADVAVAVAAARGSGAEVLKLYAMIDSALAARLTAEAHRQGMRVVAHATLFPARPLQLVQSGADILTHAPYLSWQGAATVRPQDAFDRLKGPYAGVSTDGPEITAVLRAMKQAGTFLEPTLFVFARRTEEKAVNAWATSLTSRARDAGVPIIAGTDGMIGADSTALPNIHNELQLLVNAGLTPAQALAAATIVAARAMHRERTHGAIAAGRVADIVLLEANPLADISATTRIRRVVLRGTALRR